MTITKFCVVVQFNDIVKFVPCNISVMVLINLFNRQHYFSQPIIVRKYFQELSFANWTGDFLLSVPVSDSKKAHSICWLIRSHRILNVYLFIHFFQCVIVLLVVDSSNV